MTAFILTLNYFAALCAIMHNVCLISVPNETLGEQDRGNRCLAKSKMMMLMLLLLMVLVKKRKEWGSMVVTMITRDGDENDCENCRHHDDAGAVRHHPLAVAVLAFVVAKPIDFSMECTSICPRSRHSANIDSRRQLALEELETESCQRQLHTSWRRFRRKGGGFRSIVTLRSGRTRPLQALDKRRHLLDRLALRGWPSPPRHRLSTLLCPPSLSSSSQLLTARVTTEKALSSPLT